MRGPPRRRTRSHRSRSQGLRPGAAEDDVVEYRHGVARGPAADEAARPHTGGHLDGRGSATEHFEQVAVLQEDARPTPALRRSPNAAARPAGYIIAWPVQSSSNRPFTSTERHRAAERVHRDEPGVDAGRLQLLATCIRAGFPAIQRQRRPVVGQSPVRMVARRQHGLFFVYHETDGLGDFDPMGAGRKTCAVSPLSVLWTRAVAMAGSACRPNTAFFAIATT